MEVFDQIARGMISRKDARNFLKKVNSKYTDKMIDITSSISPSGSCPIISVWRSNQYLATVYDQDGYIRISINKTDINKDGTSWKDGISWDELQRIKSEIGYGDRAAVEVYPPDERVINVSNIRHIFILKNNPEFIW